MKIISFLYLLILLSSCVATKPNYIKYYQNINEATYYLYAQKYDSANLYFERSFEFVPKIYDSDRYKYIISLNNSGRVEEALKLLKLNSTGFEQNDSIYFNNIPKDLRILFEAKALYNDSIFFDSLQKSDAYKKMMEIYKLDQKYRVKLSQLRQNGDSLEQIKYIDSIKISNSINEKEILKMIKKGGLNAGVNNPYSAYWTVVFVHLQYDFLLKNQKKFQREMLKGNLLPFHYYIGVDRAFHDDCNTKGLYLQYARNSIIDNPQDYFKVLSERGLSPYFYKAHMAYNGGATPPKSSFFDYYRENKLFFNSSNYEVELDIPKKVICK